MLNEMQMSMILTGRVSKLMGGFVNILLLSLCLNCVPVFNKNLQIEDISGVFHKKISFTEYHMDIFTIGIKSFSKKQPEFTNIYSINTKDFLFVAKNKTEGSLILESLSIIKNYNNYLEKTKYIVSKERVFILYNQDNIKVLQRSYTLRNNILIKDVIFHHKNNIFLYQIQVYRESNTIKYNFDRYVEQMFEGINLY